MDPTLLRKEFVSGLIDILNLAIDKLHLEDAEVVLNSLRVLRPKLLQLDVFEGWIAMRRRRWSEAARILSNLDRALPEFETARAFLAACQYSSGDPAWHTTATEILENSTNVEALDIVRTLLAPDAEPAAAEAPVALQATAPDAYATQIELPMRLAYQIRA